MRPVTTAPLNTNVLTKQRTALSVLVSSSFLNRNYSIIREAITHVMARTGKKCVGGFHSMMATDFHIFTACFSQRFGSRLHKGLCFVGCLVSLPNVLHATLS